MNDNRAEMRAFMRKFNRIGFFRGYGGLKIIVLRLLNEGPKNGAELMDAIDLMTHGHWRPSPGSIYPLLGKAVEDKLIIKKEDGRYELTEEGSEEISMFGTGEFEKPGSVDAILRDMDSNLSYIEDLPCEKIEQYEKMLDNIEQKLGRIQKKLHSTGVEQ
ncbi:DNA-binding PadR family transcriptional regulator [Methanomicrobium sp. W14]|uniref:PadR family transcriptional regulator n=1 Tax=Methanomicrobium sp. W14 TaxID=2817839 RepID=UPI001AE80EAD|nr:PadR family transcriptional regulator [Methanomicrobium sp. W14]MBP2133965.1 DNA-binding PadR family transcriptional regulator [Methanomicrobium sp. W14]